MIGQARQNYPNLEFKLADAASFSFPDEFDAVFSNAALHWIREPEKVDSRCVASCLRPEGRFVAEFGGKRNVDRFVAAARAVLEASRLQLRESLVFPKHRGIRSAARTKWIRGERGVALRPKDEARRWFRRDARLDSDVRVRRPRISA